MRQVISDEAGLTATAAVLNAGGVAVIPTDTVYGLAAHPDFPEAVLRLYTIKAREALKPIALLVDAVAAAERFVGPAAATIGGRYWPGALTVVGHNEGVRVPAHEWTRHLIALCGGALRVTSANLSGQCPAADAPSALAAVGLSADLVVDDGVSPGGAASTVIAVADDGQIELLRPGPVAFLTLASGSPRRAKILRDAGLDFVVYRSEAPEVSYPGDPERTVRENAILKGAAAATALARKYILSADTIVWHDGRILGKPRDLAEAREYLHRLSGQTHTVFTGVAFDGAVRVYRSEVTFAKLSEAVIDKYVEQVRPLDRAGAYDIDEHGKLLVSGYVGSYENIMGLPLEVVRDFALDKLARD